MNITENFIVKNIAGECVALPMTDDYVDFNKMIKLNETAELIYNCIAKNMDVDSIVLEITQTYNVDENLARIDTNACIDSLVNLGIIEK